MNEVSCPSTFCRSTTAFFTALSRALDSRLARATCAASPDASAAAIAARLAGSPSSTLWAAALTTTG